MQSSHRSHQKQYSLLRLCAKALVFAASIIFVYTLSQPVNAQVAACDPDYYESLRARAFIEAQREIEQNQNLIVKPDSVLEYTCFNLFGAELAQHAQDMLSESPRWGQQLPPDSMDTALTQLVGAALSSYQQANFNHRGSRLALGGRGPGKHQLPANISGGTYTCNQMNQIWQDSSNTAKCYNFNTVAAQDDFFTFLEYADGRVVRQYPQACEPDSRWQDSSSQPGQPKVALGRYQGGADDDTPWEEDRNFEFLDPTEACAQSPRIRTGVMIFENNQATVEEEICLIPGCAFVGGVCTAG